MLIKPLHVIKLRDENSEQAKTRVRKELRYEAHIINKLSDHLGLPFLYGFCSRNTPFRLVMQFHGDHKEKVSLAIASALRKKKLPIQSFR